MDFCFSDNYYVQTAFEKVISKKFISEGYYDLSRFIEPNYLKKQDIKNQLKKESSGLAALYEEYVYYKGQEYALEIIDNYMESRAYETEMTLTEAMALVNCFFKSFKTAYDRKVYLNGIAQSNTAGIKFRDGVLYDSTQVGVEFINDIDRFVKFIMSIRKENSSHRLFYRGHSMVNYELKPSVYRKDSWLKNERSMYFELRTRCANDFMNMKNHLDYLVEMQHYGLPTRLLDITANPLIALYFACESQSDQRGEVIIFALDPGEVRYSNSDTACILACLPIFTWQEQVDFYNAACDPKMSMSAFNGKIKRLLFEIKSEKPAFSNSVRKSSLTDNVVVEPFKNNSRIINQEGAFIVCGLSEETRSLGTAVYNPINDLRCRNTKGKKVVCIIENKERILKALDAFSINKAKVYPEIDDVADYIKNNV